MSSIKTNRNNYSMLNNTYGESIRTSCEHVCPKNEVCKYNFHTNSVGCVLKSSEDIREDLGSFSLQAAVRSTCIDPYTNIPGVS